MRPTDRNSGSLFAIGDIHGCYEALRALIDRLPLQPERDRLLFIGDYIDRGLYSFEVVQYLIELRLSYPGSIFLKGNHEWMLETYLEGKDRLSYLQNGGLQTIESYLAHHAGGGNSPIPAEHQAFFSTLVPYHESESHYFVHAGMRPGVPLADQREEDLLWIREEFIESKAAFGKPVVFGHTAFSEPLVQPNKIGIDTGAVYGNHLTCLRLPEMEFFQA